MEIKIVIDDRIVGAARKVSSRRGLMLTVCIALLLGGAYAYAISDTPANTFLAGEVASAAEVNRNFEELYEAVAALEQNAVLMIAENTTWTVGEENGDYLTLPEALAALDRFRIAGGANVTIDLEDGDYSHATPIEFSHPDGNRLRILGNDVDPTLVDLHFTGPGGLKVSPGSAVGEVRGVTIRGNGQSGATGVQALWGRIELTNVIVRDFGESGLVANESGVIIAPGVNVSGSGTNGLVASQGGLIVASSATVTDSATTGIFARACGVVSAQSALVSNTASGNGVHAQYNGYVDFGGGVSTNNSGGGVVAEYGGVVEASGPGSRSTDNGSDGYRADSGALVLAEDSTSEDNGARGYHSTAFSAIFASTADARRNSGDGFRAIYGSLIWAPNSVGDSNSQHGYLSTDNGYLRATGATSTNNGANGYAVSVGGTMVSASASASGNSDAARNTTPTSDTLAGTVLFE